MRIPVIVCAALLLPALARAQSAPVIELRGAFGASNYLHGDFDFIAPTALVSARVGVGALAIEPEFGIAWHSDDQKFQDVRHHEEVRFRSVGLNVVRRWPGKVSPFAEAGVGYFTNRRRTGTTSPLGNFESDVTTTNGGAQAAAGVDIQVARRVAIFGMGRYEIRSFTDPGGGSVMQALGGIAITIR